MDKERDDRGLTPGTQDNAALPTPEESCDKTSPVSPLSPPASLGTWRPTLSEMFGAFAQEHETDIARSGGEAAVRQREHIRRARENVLRAREQIDAKRAPGGAAPEDNT